jgi:hypothetical protein
MAALCFGLVARPSREVAPAGDLLFVSTKSRQKKTPRRNALRFASGSLRCSGLEGSRGTRFAQRSSDNRAKSVVEACCARALKAFRCSAVLKGGRRNTSDARPARLASRLFGFWGWAVLGSPLLNRREAQKPGGRAKRASTTDFAPLCLSVVSAANEASWARPRASSIAGNPAGAVLQGPLFAYFLAGQKVGRPPGRTPGTVHRSNRITAKAPHTSNGHDARQHR